MMISTRGRYALRVMIDLAEHSDEGYVPMKAVADRQGISLKYIQAIMSVLSKSELVKGVHGKGGGYRLAREPEECSVGEILRLTDGNLAPVTCLECDAKPCARRDKCKTLSMWTRFHSMTNEFFDSVTLADLLGEDKL